jgi:hypothetical protein
MVINDNIDITENDTIICDNQYIYKNDNELSCKLIQKAHIFQKMNLYFFNMLLSK